MEHRFSPVGAGKITLRDAELLRRRNANRRYMMSLSSRNLLYNYDLEAGISVENDGQAERHGGWEDPSCQLRGHFLGHWLSAAALYYKATGDLEVLGKANGIVAALARCQEENGGEWAASIPEKYFDRAAKGRPVWAPHYTVHKTLMGLLDLYAYAGNEQALEIARNWAKWFHRWSGGFTRSQFDDILDVETGGMLEIWANLYGLTGEAMYRDLIERYTRARLFAPIRAGADVLTNMHANTTIPEIMGAARVYEVTGDEAYLETCVAYWDCAVTNRGAFATGGQTCGEIWTPPFQFVARLGEKNQEHCTVYNMMRLAEFLLRHTGESKYTDYMERNLKNGIMAQGYWKGSFTHGAKSAHPDEGLLTYFLPMKPGARKGWATERGDFFCCHGTLVQANATHVEGIYYTCDEGAAIARYVESEARLRVGDADVTIAVAKDEFNYSGMAGSDTSGDQRLLPITTRVAGNPMKRAYRIHVRADKPCAWTLLVSVPEWARMELRINGAAIDVKPGADGFVRIERKWMDDELVATLSRRLRAEKLPDRPDTVAFLDGDTVLAGLCEDDPTIEYDESPEDALEMHNEREWGRWINAYRTRGQVKNITFVPLNEVGYDAYTIYFPTKRREK